MLRTVMMTNRGMVLRNCKYFALFYSRASTISLSVLLLCSHQAHNCIPLFGNVFVTLSYYDTIFYAYTAT